MRLDWIFGKKKKSSLPPEVEAIFKRIHEVLNSDEKQLALYPANVRTLIESGLNVDSIPNSSGPFGHVIENPIPVNGPIGEILYLSSLRRNGCPVLFHRIGSLNRIDVFECVSADGRDWDLLHLDMYHPRKSSLVPAGYTRERNALLSGTPNIVEQFPSGLYEDIVNFSKGLFGFSLADPEIRKILENTKFERSLSHLSRVRKFSVEARIP